MSPGDTPPSFGRFQLLRVVHDDGATTLHDAFDPDLGHKVALITRPAGRATAEEGRLAFRLRKMRHPNIVSVLDMGRQDDVAFIAAECLEAEPLSVFLARAGRIPVFQGLALVLQLLSAIDHAQARGMVHATIDLEQVQVTPAGRLKLPAEGWSLSSDRQPNLQAAAQMARVLLSGACPPHMRHAMDEALSRAEGMDPEALYRSADQFALALLAAAGRPVWTRPAAKKRPVAAEPEPAALVPVSTALARAHPQGRTTGSPLHRRHTGRNLLAACVVAALLVPRLFGDSTFTGKQDTPAPGPGLSLESAPASFAPTPVALAPVAPAAVALIPEAPAPAPHSPAAPAPSTPAPTEPAARPAAPAAKTAVAPQRAKRTAVRQRVTRARATAPTRHARVAKAATTRAHKRGPQVAPPLTAATGCPYEWRIARDFCKAQQCRRPEMRHTAACARILAEQRAALERLRGTPD